MEIKPVIPKHCPYDKKKKDRYHQNHSHIRHNNKHAQFKQFEL